MNAWLALTKKEFRLGLPVVISMLILYAIFIAFGYFIGQRVQFPEAAIMFALGSVVGMHVFFLVIYLSYSLSAERKRLHLWLHTPMPVAALVLSKLANGLFIMIITFVLTMTAAVLHFNEHFAMLHEQSVTSIAGYITIGVFTSAIWIAVLFLFFWSIFMIFSQRMNDFFSFLLTIVLFVVSGLFYDYVIQLPFIEMLTNWGAISANDILTSLELNAGMIEGEVALETSIFYIGHFVRDTLVTVLLFLAACWVIDKKVEV
jgi:hypothetical protein